MNNMIAEVRALYLATKGHEPERIEKLPQSGSDRVYLRIHDGGTTMIATYNLNIQENETFFAFTRHFRSKGFPMPEVYAVNVAKTVYLQQDVGQTSLLDLLEQQGEQDKIFDLYVRSLQLLAKVQVQGHNGFDYAWCITAREFGRQAMMSDLLYFKYYFLDTLKLPYDKQALMDEFEQLAAYLDAGTEKYFMYRDFQARNILVQEGDIYFIDHQGGMQGAPAYDVASLLWQAKANLSLDWKERLLTVYMDEVERLTGQELERKGFAKRYHGYVLIRLLQVLGAYGFRGLFERKAHFVTSIPLAMRNLQVFLQHYSIGIAMPELEKVMQAMLQPEVISRFEIVRATEQTPLVVRICSFSYKQGCPADETGNGGGFVFDMRGILNPGRFAEYKTQTGRDKPVIDFLEQRTRMNEFLTNVFAVVDIAVEDYINRGFENLSISFGCTGGQHRSVYAADAMARHLRNKYGVKVSLCHVVQEAKEWRNG